MIPRRSLFRKYVLAFIAVIGGLLIARGLIEIYVSYRDNTAALMTLQKEKAGAAALRIDHFIREIQNHIGWASHPYLASQESIAEQRRFDFQWLLRQVEPITEVSLLDDSGKEQLLVSRLAVDVVGSLKDYSAESKFREARVGGFHFGPLYFRNESEPYMTLAIGQGHGAGVTVAELNLKLIWDVVSQIRVGQHGYAYVVDPRGILIAHPDISLVLQKTDFSRLPQVRTALASVRNPGEEYSEAAIGKDLHDGAVLSAFAAIPRLGWSVFVEQSVREAFSPVFDIVLRTLVLVVIGLGLAIAASLMLARNMTMPIRALQSGAMQIGAGALEHRIDVHTGDELEMLADQFNRMAGQLQESYATLERLAKLEHELALASEIQVSMLPRSVPRVPGYEFSASMIPARSVGGDFYDFIPLGGGLLAVAVGDVSDKGLPAALFMAMVRSLLRAETHPDRSLQQVLRNVNRHLLDMNEKEMFVTLLFGVLNSTTRQFQYVRAGHESPMIFDAQGSFQHLPKSMGQALGVFDEIALDERTVDLPEGRILLLCSDGIPEAPNRRHTPFGYDGIARTVGRALPASAQTVCDLLIQAVAEHQVGSPQHDDITLVVLRAM